MGFKRGQSVVCVDGTGQLKTGNSYTVLEDAEEGLNAFVTLLVAGKEESWYSSRFRHNAVQPAAKSVLDSLDAAARKHAPVASGFVDYFPDAMVAVAQLSRKGNEQHNPGKPLFWDRSKSGDEADALMRHFIQRGTIDTDGVRHSAKVAWRAMALLQKEIEASK